ncbi:hypothetical protein, partial [Parabacteroides johnsonii]|uniref:hypothetical protein n=1 Tax=Parabacteroides johnsonii TaxID=387661 RepID=UPI00248DB58E
MAEKGATHYQKDYSSIIDSVLSILINIISTLFWPVLIFAIILSKSKSDSLDFGVDGKKIPKDVAYFRDIPCNSNLHRAYFIAYQYGILKNKTDVLGAIILKWIKDSLVRVEQ